MDVEVFEILQHWGSPPAAIERNNCGAQVVDNLKNQLGYNNLISFAPKNTKTTSYNFWNNNRSMHEELSKVALWWLAFPTSSIAAERSFAVSRLIDSSQRGRLGWKTISNELKLKVNKWVLKDLFKDALMKVPGMIVT